MDRPRRTLRQTTRSVQPLTEPVVRPVKRKATPEPIDPQKQLKTLLESAKSDLVALDMHVCTRATGLQAATRVRSLWCRRSMALS